MKNNPEVSAQKTTMIEIRMKRWIPDKKSVLVTCSDFDYNESFIQVISFLAVGFHNEVSLAVVKPQHKE